MKLKIGDFILIIIIVAFAILLSLPRNFNDNIVLLEVNGKVIKTFDLNTDTEYIYSNVYTNVIVVSSGELFIKSSDCPDHTCEHSGSLKQGGKNRIICCLPNKLVLRFKSNSTDTDVISG